MERKKNSSLYNKVVSLLTSILMVLSTFVSYLPTSALSVQAADHNREDLMTIEHLTNINTIDPDFDISTDAKPVTFGDFDSYTTNFENDLSETPFLGDNAIVVVQKVDDPTTDGQQPWITYHHVAKTVLLVMLMT